MVLRTQLTPIFDKYDIDVVLQGHDHTYSRTYQLTGDGNEHTKFTDSSDGNRNKEEALRNKFLSENQCYNIVDMTPGTVTDPEGTIYMEANSATGSKFYELISTQQDYIAARSQTWTPTYSVIDFTTAADGSSTSFTINTYDVESGNKIDDSYTITKTLAASDEPSDEPSNEPSDEPSNEPVSAPDNSSINSNQNSSITDASDVQQTTNSDGKDGKDGKAVQTGDTDITIFAIVALFASIAITGILLKRKNKA